MTKSYPLTNEKDYKCGYKYCLHHGQGVKPSESVVINNRHYHKDCAEVKQKIEDCVRYYFQCTESNSPWAVVTRVINTLVFNDGLPIDFIRQQIKVRRVYYSQKTPIALYGLRQAFFEKEYVL